MKRLIIIPDHDKKLSNRYKNQGRFSYTYLHGDLETDCGFDCYNIANPLDFGFEMDAVFIKEDPAKCGIIKCQYKRKPCTLFLWMDRHYHGLVVYDSDIDAYKYAEDCYNRKEILI